MVLVKQSAEVWNWKL